MKIICLLVGLSLSFAACNQVQTYTRENGWYYITDDRPDSISRNPIVTVKDFDALMLESDYLGNLIISGRAVPSKHSQWADATEKSIGKRIGFVFNDTVITAPQVNARIESGNFQISSPHGDDLKRIYNQLLKETSEISNNK